MTWRRKLPALVLAALLGVGAPATRIAAAPTDDRPAGGASDPTASEQHRAILAQFGGAYDDPKLQAYISGIGNRLKNLTPLKGERFTFTVIDSDIVNAFATPGDYVYITRGLLALARDEAEAASVLGHEIGHLVAGHPQARENRQVLAQGGAVLGQLLGQLLGGYLGGSGGAQLGGQVAGQLGQVVGTGYVQSFSREQELEADQLGIRFIEAARYEPRAMASFLEQMQAYEQLEAKLTGQSSDSVPGWLRDHPRTADRVLAASEAAAKATPSAREQDRERFLAAINGMIYGDDPAQGIVKGRTFEHPGLGFRFTAPPGFTLRNLPDAVVGQDREGQVMKFDMGKGQTSDPQDYLTNEWGRRTRVSRVIGFTADGRPAAAGTAQVRINDQPAEALLVAIRGEDQTFYRFLFADAQGGLSRADVNEFEESAKSFERLPPGAADAIKPLRVQAHTVRSGETQEGLAKLMAVDQLPLETFRTLNGLKPGQPLAPGDAVKLVARG